MNILGPDARRAVAAICILGTLGSATALAQGPDVDRVMAHLPGPRGVMIPVPPAVQRKLTDYRKKLHGRLRGNDRTYYVIGLLESTWQPRSATIGDGIRGIAVVLDVVMLPVSLAVGEPMALSKQLPPVPRDWTRRDEPQVHVAKGQDAAIELVYSFMTARLLDPANPQEMRRIRRWYLLKRTGKQAVAETSAEQIKQAMARAAGPSAIGEALAQIKNLFTPTADQPAPPPVIDPDNPKLKPLLKEYRDLMARAEKMESSEFADALRKLNKRFAAALPAD